MRTRPPLLAGVFAALLAAIGLSASVSLLWLGHATRSTLKVHFLSGFRQPAGEAAHIWLANSRLTLGVGVCILVVLFARRLAPGGLHGVERLPFLIADALLALTLLRTSVLAGLLLGAYGAAQARVFLPYAPVELFAWSVLTVLYIHARRGRHGLWRVARGVLAVEALLAAAAVMEAFL